jgi:hypothetical protein
MFTTIKTLNAVKADRDYWIAEESKTRDLLAHARESARTLDLVAAKYKNERDDWMNRALVAEAKVARMTGGLRQNRKSLPIEVRELQ